jgi:hypothetical protein
MTEVTFIELSDFPEVVVSAVLPALVLIDLSRRLRAIAERLGAAVLVLPCDVPRLNTDELHGFTNLTCDK